MDEMSDGWTAPDLVGVIGAGPAGLAAARALATAGVAFEVLEKHEDVGGIWARRADSPMYASAHFISSAARSSFTGFPFAEESGIYPSHRSVSRYLGEFAERFALRQHIRFRTEVKRASADPSGWRVELATGEAKHYRALILATGSNWTPRAPSYPGQFDGEIRHSSTYRDPEEFRGRSVLIIGGGNSAVDIACDAARAADSAWISLRRGYHFVPKMMMGTPTDELSTTGAWLPSGVRRRLFAGLIGLQTGPLTRYGLPAPDHPIFSTHPIMNTQLLHYLAHGDIVAKSDVRRFCGKIVEIADGSRLGPDLVITATGFRKTIPFVSPEDLGGDSTPRFLLQMFSERHDTLFGLSYFETNSGIYPLFERMAYLIARALADGPSTVALLKQRARRLEADVSKALELVQSDRHRAYVDSQAYRRTLDRLSHQMGWGVVSDVYLDNGIAA